MHTARGTARQGLILGLAGFEASAMLAAGAARHVGWWLDWHTRVHPQVALQGAQASEPLHAAMRLMRAA